MPEENDPQEDKAFSPEAEERKARSIARLGKEGIQASSELPPIEDSEEALLRTKEEIAIRAIGICLAAAKSEGIKAEELNAWIEDFGARPFFTPEEKAFIENPNPTEEERNNFAWGYESYYVLLWAIGYVKRLGRPTKTCDIAAAVTILQERGTAGFLEEAVLRPLSEILDEADLTYRYIWAMDDGFSKGEADVPGGLDPGVVESRHHALNWLIGYMDEEWDDVTTDS